MSISQNVFKGIPARYNTGTMIANAHYILWPIPA